jgi:hypothetical protein
MKIRDKTAAKNKYLAYNLIEELDRLFKGMKNGFLLIE